MHSHQDSYIHELPVDTIINILHQGAWKVGNQSITSAITNDTNLNQPDLQWMAVNENTAGANAFADIKFNRYVKRILDVGGGRFDCNHNYMKRERNIELLVWDPYNRSTSHNNQVQAEVEKYKVDAASSMSVLNVIPEADIRLAHITTLKSALIIGGKAYFKIWPGEQPLLGTYLPSSTDTYYQANAYADRFLREIEIVFGKGNVRIDSQVPNLIIAVKLSESHTNRQEIVDIQKNSKKELLKLIRIREKSISSLYSRTNIYKLFSSNLAFFKKMDNDYIEQKRYYDANFQYEYDKRYGLVLYKK